MAYHGDMSTDIETQAVREDFEVREHEHKAVRVGRIMYVCTVCGALGRTGAVILWGRAPVLSRLAADAADEYVREQAS
jgi:hypothetical protein